MTDAKKPTAEPPSMAARLRGAVWGQFVGDAYCLGSHWIYDLEELSRRFPEGIRGFETPDTGHYHHGKHAGELTHYGDAALLQLQCLAETGGFDPVLFGSRFVDMVGSHDYAGYRDKAAKGTLANALRFREQQPDQDYGYQDGADDDQPATVSRLAPIAVCHARDDDYLLTVERATRVCQDNARAIAYAKAHALLLRELFQGSTFLDALRTVAGIMFVVGVEGVEVSERINAAMAQQSLSVREATLMFGQSCPLRSSFPAAVHAALSHGNDFPRAVHEIAAAGGDSAGRASMVGAWLGASLGMAAIPQEWRDMLVARETIAGSVESIIEKSCWL